MGFLNKSGQNQQNTGQSQQNTAQNQQTWVPLQPMNQQGAAPQQYQDYAPQKPQYYVSEQSNYQNTAQSQVQGYAPRQNGLFPPQQSQANFNANQKAVLNPQQYGASSQNLFGNTPPQDNIQQPNYVTAAYQDPGPYTNPRLAQLEEKYKSFKHYAIANLVFIAIAIVSLFYNVIDTLSLESHVWLCQYIYISDSSRNSCRNGHIGYSISGILQTFLIACYMMIIISHTGIACGVYFFGKLSYDQMNAKNLRLLMIVCGMLSVGSILTLSLYNIGHFAYLAWCAWQLKGLALEITTLKSALLA